MKISQPGFIQPVNGSGDLRRSASTPEDAAQQFEAVLMRQFVAVMTKDLFKDSLAGDDGPGWINGQQDTQREVMTDVLTRHLVESRAFRISDLLMRQWQGREATDSSTAQEQELP